MATIRGQDGVIKLGGTAIGEVKSFELSIQVDAIDVTPKGSAWRKKKPGHKSWSGRATVQYDPADTAQAAAWTNIDDSSNAALTPAIIVYPAGLTGSGIYSGSVVLTGHTVTSPEDSSVVTLEITFDGAGDLDSGAGS